MNRKLVRNKNKGILFFITGLAGSGKTSIAKKIKKRISSLYGPTLEVSGDNFRKIFKFNKYTSKARSEYLMNYSELKITVIIYGRGHRTNLLVVKRDQKFPKGGILGFLGKNNDCETRPEGFWYRIWN